MAKKKRYCPPRKRKRRTYEGKSYAEMVVDWGWGEFKKGRKRRRKRRKKMMKKRGSIHG